MLKSKSRAEKNARIATRQDKAKTKSLEFVEWNEWLTKRTASAVSVVIHYRPTVARYTIHQDKADFVFSFGEPLDYREQKESIQADDWGLGEPLDAHEVLENFQKAKGPTEMLEFLNGTGAFLPRDENFTLSQLEKWQRLAYLIRERKALEEAAQQHRTGGEAVEALKAIEGSYDSDFFSADQRKDLAAWFRSPPGVRRFVPRSEDPRLARELRAGAMIEFLRPRDKLQHVFLIEPKVTLQAIAAAIYADWIAGVDYGTCSVCSKLFETRRSSQKYCPGSSCKGTAHQRRYRATCKRTAAVTKGKKHGKA